MEVKHFQAWAVIFKDGEPMRLSLSRGQKSSIALARRYFGVPWKALKGRGMRCVQVTIETPTLSSAVSVANPLELNVRGK